jgi:membrane fusion protein (multidrug efflux system)
MSTVTLDSQAAASAPPRRAPPVSRKSLTAVGLALFAGIAGAGVILAPHNTVSTDAAYVEADRSMVAPKVRGLIAEVLVNHNQLVTKGQPLIRIDPEEFDARVAAAQADLSDAEAAALSAHAALSSLGADEALARSKIVSARTTIDAADAENLRAQQDRKRFDTLRDSGVVARQDVEQRQATAVAAQSAADRARADLDVSRNQSAVVSAKRDVLGADIARAEASVAKARAALELAKQDQTNAVIRAPIDGVVGDRQAEPGDYVQPGSRLLTLVPAHGLYVTANFKETQTGRMRIGQKADIKVDALPGDHFTGVVDSLAPGSGSSFALLPFEPGTGNFTKVVQRVPVRIRLDPTQAHLSDLRPGLSTTVKVRLKG